MSRHWTVSLTCEDCGAVIQYEDERPAWIEDGPDLELVEAAEAWVAANPHAGNLTTKCPAYAHWNPFGSNYVEVPAPSYYVICPACDGRAYRARRASAQEGGGDA